MRKTLPVLLALGALLPVPTLRAQATVSPAIAIWRELGDTTLSRLIDDALGANLDLVLATSRVAEARSARARAGWALAPSVALHGSYTRQRLGAAVFPGMGTRPADRDLWDVGAEASWEIDLSGRLRAGWQGERALADASEADRQAVALLVTSEVTRAYIEVRGTQAQLRVLDDNLVNLRRALALTEERLAAGRGTALDTERARTQVALTEAARHDVAAALEVPVARLAALLARSPAALREELSAAAAIPVTPMLDSLPLRTLLLARPDVRAAEQRLQAAQARQRAARAAYLPRLTMVASVGSVTTASDRLWGAGTSRFAVGPVLSWPILNLGRIGAEAGIAAAQRDAARVAHDQVMVQATADAHALLARYRANLRREAALATAVEASRRAGDLSLLRFQGGASDFLQVLDTERTRLAAEAQFVSAMQARAEAFVAAVQALGGRVEP